jgi:hypothetical protein
MHVMFVHQNFPAQFRYIAPKLVSDFGWRCTFVTEKEAGKLPGVDKVVYTAHGGATMANHVCTRTFENQVAQTLGVYAALASCVVRFASCFVHFASSPVHFASCFFHFAS